MKTQANVDNEDTLDPVKEEVLRELEAIYAWQGSNPSQAVQDAGAAAEIVRGAIEDFWRHLACARNLRGEPHRLARAFGKYIEEHVLGPSRESGQAAWVCVRNQTERTDRVGGRRGS